MRVCLSFLVVEQLRMGVPVSEACRRGIKRLKECFAQSHAAASFSFTFALGAHRWGVYLVCSLVCMFIWSIHSPPLTGKKDKAQPAAAAAAQPLMHDKCVHLPVPITRTHHPFLSLPHSFIPHTRVFPSLSSSG